MTIVSYKDGYMCSDSLVTQNDLKLGTVKKLFKVGQYTIGVAGTYQHAVAFVQWFADGRPEKRPDFDGDKPNFDALVYDSTVDLVFYYQDGFTGDLIHSDCHAIGSGAELAIGAMEAGATAYEAVKITIKRSSNCGGRAVKIKLK